MGSLMSNIDSFLGQFADDLGDETKQSLAAALEGAEARYGDPDEADDLNSAYSGAAMLAFGDSSLEELADEWRSARAAERERMATLTGAIIYAAQSESENSLSERLNINRATIRKALGK